MTDGPSAGATEVSGWGPPIPKQKKSRGKKILIWVIAVIGVLVLGFGALVAYYANDAKNEYDATASLQEGQCLNVTRMNTTDPGVVAADCASAAANYRIGVRLAGGNADCPAGDYDVYQQGARFSQDVTFCLIPIFAKGQCYVLSDSGIGTAPCKTAATGTVIRVQQILANTTDKKQCTKGNLALSYSKPATVFCATTL
jgi:hypothetical protein